jgi:hypothetical protein
MNKAALTFIGGNDCDSSTTIPQPRQERSTVVVYSRPTLLIAPAKVIDKNEENLFRCDKLGGQEKSQMNKCVLMSISL